MSFCFSSHLISQKVIKTGLHRDECSNAANGVSEDDIKIKKRRKYEIADGSNLDERGRKMMRKNKGTPEKSTNVSEIPRMLCVCENSNIC